MSHSAVVYPSLKGRFVVQQVETPIPETDEVLIKVTHAALNPVDYKIQRVGRFFDTFPRVLGLDAAGIVVKVGDGISDFKVGDKVAGMTKLFPQPAATTKVGAFQEYTILNKPTMFKVEGAVNLEQAASVPLALATAVDGLDLLGLDLMALSSKPASKKAERLLVYGGAASIGQLTVQIAHFLGYHVVVVASAKQHSFLRSLGADSLIDYKDPDLADQLEAAFSKDGLPFVYDAIADGKTIPVIHDLLAKVNPPHNVVAKSVFASMTPDLLGIEFDPKVHGSATRLFAGTLLEQKQTLGAKVFTWVGEGLAQGYLRPNPIHIVSTGLETVQDQVDRYAEQPASGAKNVIAIAQE
ncbi:Zinc-binding oxidoreductase alcohol dehydrogenase [Savitreella phatthalungensis]